MVNCGELNVVMDAVMDSRWTCMEEEQKKREEGKMHMQQDTPCVGMACLTQGGSLRHVAGRQGAELGAAAAAADDACPFLCVLSFGHVLHAAVCCMKCFVELHAAAWGGCCWSGVVHTRVYVLPCCCVAS